MKTARTFSLVTKRFYRPEQSVCPECQRHLRRAVTVSERTIISLDGVLKIVHAGYRCPHPDCLAPKRTYRNTVADQLALPGFTFGFDIVLLIGHWRLSQHYTLDETHHHLLAACRREGNANSSGMVDCVHEKNIQNRGL